MKKKLMKGSEVLGASAIKAGCLHFFGYPITPQNEIPEYMSKELGIKQDIILGKIEHAKKVISNWEFYCDNNHMSDKDKLKIRNAISLGLNRKNAEYELKVQKTINHVPKLKLTK